jgi:hypothetical protein
MLMEAKTDPVQSDKLSFGDLPQADPSVANQLRKPLSRLYSKFNSAEKQFVRNRLWVPVFRNTLQEKRMRHKKIRYLCFPSPACAFVKQLLGMQLISDNTFVVGIEPNEYYHRIILEFFAGRFKKGVYEILQGRFEDLISDNVLRQKFPFDILELDFPGPFFSLTPSKESRLLTAIETSLLQQAFHNKPCHLITSFKTGGSLPEPLRASYADLQDFVVREILQRENSALGNGTLRAFLNSGPHQDRYAEWCCLYAIPLAIIRNTSNLFDVQLESFPHTYVSTSEGATSRIVSYTFICRPRRRGSFDQATLETSLKDALTKTAQSVWYGA